MHRIVLALSAGVSACALAAPVPAAPMPAPPSHAAAYQAPPSAQLQYAVKARQRGFDLTGASTVGWQAGGDQYRVQSATVAHLFGKIVDASSEGAIDAQGLAPAQHVEKRIRKTQTVTTFNRDARSVTFSANDESAPLKGGEQDRLSVLWQLLGQARANPGRFVPGYTVAYQVAGPRAVGTWSFKVAGKETIATPLGPQACVHLTKAPPPQSQDQQVDIWLAPGLEWYPVKIRFTDNDGDYIEQQLEKISSR